MLVLLLNLFYIVCNMEATGKYCSLPCQPFCCWFYLKMVWLAQGKDTVRNMDMISSLSSGVTNVTKDVIGLYFIILSYPFFLRYLAITRIPSTLLVYIIAFLHWTLPATGYTVCSMSAIFSGTVI